MGLSERLDRIDRNIRSIKAALAEAACTCRGKGRKICETNYHTVEELEAILYVPCPVHGLRTPGVIFWSPDHSPLQRPDWEFCNSEFGKCRPHWDRDYQMGKRPKPTEEERQREISAQCLEGALFMENAAKDPEAARIEFAKGTARVDAVIEKFRTQLRAARGM